MKSTLAITFVSDHVVILTFILPQKCYTGITKKRITDYYYLTLVCNNLDVNFIFSKEYTKIVVINPLICLI